MWSAIFYALTAILCALCLTGCVFVVQRAAADAELQRKKIRSCESRIELLNTSLEELTQTVTEIANRAKMQRVRAAANHATGSSGEPDPYKNPDEWRSMMSRKLALAKTGMQK